MHDAIFSAVIDAIEAYKSAAKGVPNVLARDVGAVHRNTTPADLPAEVRAAVQASVAGAFARLRKEGYAVAPVEATRAAPPPRTPARPGPRPGPRPGGPPVVERKRRPPTGPGGKPPAKKP